MRIALTALLALAGCVESAPVTRRAPAPPPQPSKLDALLGKHRSHSDELRAAQEKFVAAHDGFEQQKAAYLLALSTELAAAKTKPEALRAVTMMATERTKIATELSNAVRSLGEALLARAEAVREQLTIEGALWDTEAQAAGGRAAAAKLAEPEILELHDAETTLHVAQKGQQSSLAALLEKEFEFTATIGEDVQARDRADRQLTAMRNDLGERYDRLIDVARRCDEASGRVHLKLLQSIPPPEKILADRMRELLARREKATAAIAAARSKLKDAVMRRGEQRARELAHDGEIAAIVDGGFKAPAARDALLAKVRPQRDAASEARVAMQREETALADARKRLATLEADAQSLGY